MWNPYTLILVHNSEYIVHQPFATVGVNIINAPKICEIFMVLFKYLFFQYCDSNIGLFSILLVRLCLLFFWLIFCNSSASFLGCSPQSNRSYSLSLFLALRGDNYMGNNIEKKPRTNLQNRYKKWSKEVKSDNFCCWKVGRAITERGTILENLSFWSRTKNLGVPMTFKSSPSTYYNLSWFIIIYYVDQDYHEEVINRIYAHHGVRQNVYSFPFNTLRKIGKKENR